MSRRQPSIGTTVRSAPMPHASLKNRASSAIVIPWRSGIGNCPTNDSKPFTSIGPVDLLAADGVRTIGDDDRHAVLLARAQAVRHRVDEGVDARADVLQIDHEHVEPLQHLRRRLAGFAVQRVDRHSARRVVRVTGLDHVVLHVGAIAVLRAEDGAPASRRAHRRSARTMCRNFASMEAGFETMPTRLFLSAPDASSCSDPSRTCAFRTSVFVIIFAPPAVQAFFVITTIRNGISVARKDREPRGSRWKYPEPHRVLDGIQHEKRRADRAESVRFLHDDLARLEGHARRLVFAERRDHRRHVARPGPEAVAERVLQKRFFACGNTLVIDEAEQHHNYRQVPRARQQRTPERDERVGEIERVAHDRVRATARQRVRRRPSRPSRRGAMGRGADRQRPGQAGPKARPER